MRRPAERRRYAGRRVQSVGGPAAATPPVPRTADTTTLTADTTTVKADRG